MVLAHRNRAVGQRPACIRNDQAPSAQELQALAREGYVAVSIEMVSSRDGTPVSADFWNALAVACAQAGLFLIVDEAATAMRCGAPFCHQRPEYGAHVPTLVLFGKGFRLAGLAVHHDGIGVRDALGITSRAELLRRAGEIRGAASEVVTIPTILHAQNVLDLAIAEDWPARSSQIGYNLRQLISDLQRPSQPGHRQRYSTRLKSKLRHNNDRSSSNAATDAIRGIDSLIYLPRRAAWQFNAVGASTGPTLLRWFAFLDEPLASMSTVFALFGPGSYSLRGSLVEVIGYCGICGLGDHEAVPEDYDRPPPGDEGALFICPSCRCPICFWCRSEANKRPSSAVARTIKKHTVGRCYGNSSIKER